MDTPAVTAGCSQRALTHSQPTLPSMGPPPGFTPEIGLSNHVSLLLLQLVKKVGLAHSFLVNMTMGQGCGSWYSVCLARAKLCIPSPAQALVSCTVCLKVELGILSALSRLILTLSYLLLPTLWFCVQFFCAWKQFRFGKFGLDMNKRKFLLLWLLTRVLLCVTQYSPDTQVAIALEVDAFESKSSGVKL